MAVMVQKSSIMLKFELPHPIFTIISTKFTQLIIESEFLLLTYNCNHFISCPPWISELDGLKNDLNVA